MIIRKLAVLGLLTPPLLLAGCNLFLDLVPLPSDTNLGVEDAGLDLSVDQDMGAEMGPVLRPIGPRTVSPTPLEQGTLFAAPDGTGTTCSQTAPCDVYEAASQAAASDVVFLRGGVYTITRNLSFVGASPALVVESYPNEEAILDGSNLGPDDNVYIRLLGGPVIVRLLTIRNMPKEGISVRTSDNVLEGLKVYGNRLSGIHVHESYDVPVSNRNIIRDSIVWGNSGAGILDQEYADGGNSDGISISSGEGNRVENCLVYGNSDDGVDVWRSTDSYIGYTTTHDNGLASGDGHGISAGGMAPSARTVVEHNLSYSNLTTGFAFNSGVDVIFRHNTSWNNELGFRLADDTVSTQNLAFEEATHTGEGVQSGNSWQQESSPTPRSTAPESDNFLVPSEPDFEGMGAYADRE